MVKEIIERIDFNNCNFFLDGTFGAGGHTNEILSNALKSMSNEEKAKIFPPITRKNFVVRESWMNRNQIITFINNKNQKVTYNHDEVLEAMLPKLQFQACWLKRKYWSQSTNLPTNVRHLAEIIDLESTEK